MAQRQTQNESIVTLPNLYKYGFVLSFLSRKSLLVSGGMCRDANNLVDIEVGYPDAEGDNFVQSPMILDATKNGFNGLDVRTLAGSTLYGIYIISDSRNYKPTGCIATISRNSVPLLPTGYDSYRLVGYWPTRADGLFAEGAYSGIGNDMFFRWLDGQNALLNNATSTVETTFSVGAFVPPVNNTLVTFMVNYVDTQGLNAVVGSPINTGGNVFVTAQSTGVGMTFQANQMSSLVNGLPSLKYSTSATGLLSLFMNGFSVRV